MRRCHLRRPEGSEGARGRGDESCKAENKLGLFEELQGGCMAEPKWAR